MGLILDQLDINFLLNDYFVYFKPKILNKFSPKISQQLLIAAACIFTHSLCIDMPYDVIHFLTNQTLTCC